MASDPANNSISKLASDPALLQQTCEHASQIIRDGGVIAYPTEAVYGLGCDPGNRAALQKLLALKHRADHKGFIVVAGAESQLTQFILPLPESAAGTIRASWPGPVTWVVPARADLHPELTGGRQTLAVRVSTHPVIQTLCGILNQAIVSTSANLSTQTELRSAAQVNETFGTRLDCIIDAPLGNADAPSKIFDAVTLKQLR